MSRNSISHMAAWPSISIEGNLIAPAMIAQITSLAQRDDEQMRQAYRVRKGLTLREEISTAFRVGQSHFDSFRRLEAPSLDATRRFMRDFLSETLGFSDIASGQGVLSFLAGERVPVVVVPPTDEKLDRRSAALSADRSRSAAYALQDHLNDHDDCLWGLATNGTVIRLMRDNASLTRPTFIEADLAQIFTNEDASSFAVLWLLFHRTSFGAPGDPATDCPLERWRETGSREGEAARDRLAGQVRDALKLLGSGFLDSNPDLAAKLKSGEVNLTEWFNELLRLVYRLIFLMVAEDRNLLHPKSASNDARKLYADGYSLTHLRQQCFRAATWDRHHDRYEGVKVIFAALTAGQDALGLPALGGLFAPNNLPHLETARLRNRAFMEALYRLSWLQGRSGMTPVNWRAMETEELGSVYESLLELQPQMGDDGRSLVFASDAAEQKGNQRKTTGSYYTPDSLVQALLDTALDPVLDKTVAEADDPAKELLRLAIIDPACGSGHFLLAAARRIASRLARIRADGTPSSEDYRHALRDVARDCIHGVDRNPMAVELTKVALWIETVDPGKPLGFFDAQIRCGDALLGVFDLNVLEDGIPDAAFKPLTGDDRETAKYYLRANKDAKGGQGRLDFFGGKSRVPAMRPFMTEYTGFRALTEETIADIKAKDRSFKTLRESHDFRKKEIACDLYISAFLLPKVDGAPASRGARSIPTTADVWQALDDGEVWGPLIRQAEVARRARAFHWPLEFPDVMGRGGFDVVLGNPPWERIKLQEQEFFAARSPEIAGAANKAARDRLIRTLAAADEGTPEHSLFNAFTGAKREAEAIGEFVRLPGDTGGRFALTGRGDVNTYALFAELFADLARQRAGVIVPTGIATDATTAPFFAYLVERKRLARLVDFENSKPIFPSVHRSFKFALLTLGHNEPAARFAFFLTEPAQLAEPERNFILSSAEIAAINPNTKTAPVFRTRADAELTAKIYANTPVLIDEIMGAKGNSWGAFYLRLIHYGDHSEELYSEERAITDGFQLIDNTWDKGQEILLPIYESKFVNLFDHRYATSDNNGEVSEIEKKTQPTKELFPRYWVTKRFFDDLMAKYKYRRKWLLAYRDIARSNDVRTMITMAIPRGPASVNLPTLGFSEEVPSHALLANMAALSLDFVARQSISGTHMTFGVLKQLPILPPDFYTEPRLAFITPKVLELTYTSHSLAPFARDLGYDGPPFTWDEDRRALLRADLDAFYARAYGLTRDELRYILDPSDVKGPDYPSETFRVLKDKEIRQYGLFRTQRLVLEAWDRMEADGTFVELGLSDAPVALQQPVAAALPELQELPDGIWAWSERFDAAARLNMAIRYTLWVADPEASADLRLAVQCMVSPALLTNMLPRRERGHWLRLMGDAAEPQADVTRMRPRTDANWRDAYTSLIGSGWVADGSDGNWTKGPAFDGNKLDPNSRHAQRATFVMQAIRQLDRQKTTHIIEQADNIIPLRFANGTG